MARLPSTQSLRAIEAFARHGTVWQAAEELNLTRSAVSHQLRLLERELGFKLLDRVGKTVKLTSRGSALAEDARRALGIVAGSIARNAATQTGGALTISSPPGFATGWLCSRIGAFHERYPDIIVNIVTPRRLDSTAEPDVDVFIIFGKQQPDDMVVEELQRVEFTPMCSPAYLNRFDGFSSPQHLQGATLLHIHDYGDWENWMRMIGRPPSEARRGIVCQDMNLVYAAALSSQGIAMGDEFACQRMLSEGQIVRPFKSSMGSENAYSLATPLTKADVPNVKAFHAWLADALGKKDTS